MMHTAPVTIGKRRKLQGKASFWIPTVGAEVRVLWVDNDNSRGKQGMWHAGKVTELSWPEEKGTPGAYIRYLEDGVEEWHAMPLFGESVELLKAPADRLVCVQGSKKRAKIEHRERFPLHATQY